MILAALGFLVGVVWVQHAASLHALGGYAAAAIMLFAGFRRPSFFKPLLHFAIALCLGCAYATIRAEYRLATRIPDTLDRTTVTWAGTVIGLPVRVVGGVRFQFQPDPSPSDHPAVGRLVLSWYPADKDAHELNAVRPGARLSLTIRLRRATSLFNPSGFDQAGWFLAHGLAGRGFVTDGAVLETASSDRIDPERIDRIRDDLRQWITSETGGEVTGPLIAMALGDQSGISEATWETLRATGTAHLVAISGLHVGIVAGLVAACVGWCWRRVPFLVLRIPARHAAIWAACAAALGYAALAGFGIPVVRAVLMLSVAAFALCRGRAVSTARVLSLAMIAVLIFDPWAVLSAGFWLSFCAVAALLMALAGRARRASRLRQFVVAQWAISWVTLPIVLGAFGQVSWVSPLANAVAIPLVSLLIVPLLLLATVSGSAGLLWTAAWLLAHLLKVLDFLAVWNMDLTWPAVPLWLTVIACGGLAVSLLPRGTPLKWIAVTCCVPLIFWHPVGPAPGTVSMTIMDVGQGLSVLVRTARHALLYDAGRAYYRGGDAGRSVVLPSLAQVGVDHLDMMVLSHDDNDHVGGAVSVSRGVTVSEIVAGVGVLWPDRILEGCAAGGVWQWDEVGFEWLYPTAGHITKNDNDRSCVLRIRVGGRSLLLTGDITHVAEADLIASNPLDDVTVVVAPHHGSKSSSSDAFIEAVRAEHVIFSAGFKNAYGHPAPSIVTRWRAHGVRTWNTAEVGAVSVELTRSGVSLAGQASQARRYWHRQ